jgi:hypothetical protein
MGMKVGTEIEDRDIKIENGDLNKDQDQEWDRNRGSRSKLRIGIAIKNRKPERD